MSPFSPQVNQKEKIPGIPRWRAPALMTTVTKQLGGGRGGGGGGGRDSIPSTELGAPN